MKQDGIDPKQQLEAEQVTVNQDQKIQQNFMQKLQVGPAQQTQDRPPRHISLMTATFLTLLLLGVVVPAVCGSETPSDNYFPDVQFDAQLQHNLPQGIRATYKDMREYLLKLANNLDIPQGNAPARLQHLRARVNSLPGITITELFYCASVLYYWAYNHTCRNVHFYTVSRFSC